MFNKIIMVGNLTREVEFKYLPSGSAYATVGIASNRRYKKQDGTQGEEVCFVDLKLFSRLAEIAQQYLHKGSRVLIEGKLNYETWTDQKGERCSRHTIAVESLKMLDNKAEPQAQSDVQTQQYQQQAMQNPAINAPSYQMPQNQGQYSNHHVIPEININDEIPF